MVAAAGGPPVSIADLQTALKRYRGVADDLPHSEIVPRTIIEDRAHGIDGADPEFDQWTVEKLECRIRRPPNGLELRTLCAVVGMPLLEALRHLDYWPPLRLGRKASGLALVRYLCRELGLKVSAEDLESGRVVIQL